LAVALRGRGFVALALRRARFRGSRSAEERGSWLSRSGGRGFVRGRAVSLGLEAVASLPAAITSFRGRPARLRLTKPRLYRANVGRSARRSGQTNVIAARRPVRRGPPHRARTRDRPAARAPATDRPRRARTGARLAVPPPPCVRASGELRSSGRASTQTRSRQQRQRRTALPRRVYDRRNRGYIAPT
jgi:hypothetical protein